MKSGISGIHLWGCWFSKRLFTVRSYHPSCSCHATSNTHGTSSHVSQQQDTLYVAAMSLYEPLKCPHFPLNHSNNYCWTFQILPVILPDKKKEATEYHDHYQMQNVSETAKIFKYISEYIFHKTQLMVMHNTVMTSNTNGVPPSKTYMQISFTQCRISQPVQI